MRIGLLGDTHGDFGWILNSIDLFAREGIDTIWQMGDLGVWHGKQDEIGWNKVNDELIRRNMDFYAVPGNHENYDRIERLPVSEDSGLQIFQSRIWIFPRGYRFSVGGVSVVALGGAPSVDRYYRLRGMRASISAFPPGMVPEERKTWWEQEAITPEDVAKTIEGGHADVMLCHDAPEGVQGINRIISGNPHGFQKADLEYAAEGRALLTEAFLAVRPKILFHGHYHFPVQETIPNGDGESRIVGLSKNNDSYSLGVFDTKEMSTVLWKLYWDREGKLSVAI